MEIRAVNVNDALYQGVHAFIDYPTRVREVSPRGKLTLEWAEPVITHYSHPWQRVLFDPARDCNPFLHFFESLWLLAGRRDLKFMQDVAPQFAEYSDDGVHLQGSYGYRWRNFGGLRGGEDQLEYIIKLLKADPDTRRAVLTMWHPSDLWDIGSTDIPCNTQAYFKIRNGELRMTVCNRSNDMLWGAYGANAVQFSTLQEYIAGRVGCNIGCYTQMSDSFHVYVVGKEGEVWERVSQACRENRLRHKSHYTYLCTNYPLSSGDSGWDEDLANFFHQYDAYGKVLTNAKLFSTKWWRKVAAPMWNTFITRTLEHVEHIEASDWRVAVYEWIDRRTK